jgi:hypothetical protein
MISENALNASDININWKPATIQYLIDQMACGKIDIEPDNTIWSFSGMSSFIESIMIRIPFPPVFLDMSPDKRYYAEGTWRVVDGLKRLLAIKLFALEKKLILDGDELEYLKSLKGLNYDGLPRNYQRMIDERPITLCMIEHGTPNRVKYSIERRIKGTLSWE